MMVDTDSDNGFTQSRWQQQRQQDGWLVGQQHDMMSPKSQ